MTLNYRIYDWAGNEPFGDIRFSTFEDAWDHIMEHVDDEDAHQEYHVDQE
jgi:hypothetical protein